VQINALDELDIIWRPHWPIGRCESGTGAHQMHFIDITNTWYCGGCEAWFEADDTPAVIASGQREIALATDHQN